MPVSVPLVASIIFQLAAAVLALRLIRITGWRWAWLVLASSILLMVVRRVVTLFALWTEQGLHAPGGAAEWVALGTSALMLAGVAGIAPLVSAVGRSEGILRDGEEFTRDLVQLAPFGIIYLSTDGTVLYTNPASDRMTGVPPQQMSVAIGRRLQQLPAIRAQPKVADRINRLLLGEPFRDFEVVYRSLMGAELTIMVSGTPRLGPDGSVTGALIVYTDVTERRRLEEQLRQAQKMEAVGLLAGGVAHDFNNLLMVVLGSVELVKRDVSASERTLEALEQVEQCALSAGALTRQLLTFSRRQFANPERMNLNEVLESRKALLRRLIGEDIKLELHLASDLDLIHADSGQIEQVIMNLAVNAREAMPDGGELTITTRNELLRETFAATHPDTRPGPHVVLSVRDTGLGMDKDVIERVFDPFFTTKRPGKGTGLGLSIVYGIVKQAGGNISVESKPRAGTTFTVRFPHVDG
ncbi:MAG: PAS domain-containing protein [Phycisphaerales bacterium]|nr:MAG: PAS domain-containing protein [Phycisphaerales bacterium]